MWPVLDEFRLASSQVTDENRRQIDKRIAVKNKSADDYVGQPRDAKSSCDEKNHKCF